MTKQNIVEWMIQNKVALVGYQAGHIYEGLKLWACGTYEEQIERVNLYRAWRPKTDKKNEIPSWQAFQLAIAGIDPDDVEPRQIDMFDMSEPATPEDDTAAYHGQVDAV